MVGFRRRTELVFGGGGSDVVETAREYDFARMICAEWRSRQPSDLFDQWWADSGIRSRFVTSYHATELTTLPEFEVRRHSRETSVVRHRVWTDELRWPTTALACGLEDLVLTLRHLQQRYDLDDPPALPSLEDVRREVDAHRELFDGLRALGPYFPRSESRGSND